MTVCNIKPGIGGERPVPGACVRLKTASLY